MKICIVGGGTAGWLAALFISKIKPNHQVTVIESSNIGIVGAGEGSTGALVDVITNRIWPFGCDQIDFLKETGATLKYGILHRDWTGVGESYFGPLDGTPTSGTVFDYAYAYGHAYMDKPYLTTALGNLYDANYSNFSIKNFDFVRTNHIGHALHFDAHKVGQYFKKICNQSNNVKTIDSEVEEVVLDEHGYIKSLKLSNNSTIDADFFVDASGFKRVLMNKLEVPWHSYKKNLPVNSAMPFLLKYDDGEVPQPYTTAWAQGAGWMWQIPQQNRIGCGYVFCDDFTTADAAQEEIEKALGKEIEPIRILKFDTGRLENLWHKNCLAIGLCAAFAEPLEATSIHSTIVQLYNFTFEFLKDSFLDTVNQGSIKLYNKRITQLYDDYKDFLVMHYMGDRQDTEFWKYISAGNTRTEKVVDMLETAKSRMPTSGDIPNYFGAAGWGLWSFVMGGTNNLSKELCQRELENTYSDQGIQLKVLAKQYIEDLRNDAEKSMKDLMSYKNFVNFIRS